MLSVPVPAGLGLCQPRSAIPSGKTNLPRGDMPLLLALVLGTPQILLSCRSASWPTLSPDTLSFVPVRHFKSWYKQALKIGRRAQLGSHTAGK